MANKIVLKSSDLDGYLTDLDKDKINKVDLLYKKSLNACKILSKDRFNKEAVNTLVDNSAEIGNYLNTVVSNEKNIHVYCFETAQVQHGAVSRIIAKLRNPSTGHEEFLYYIQRAYEILFAHIYADVSLPQKRSVITETPVTFPCQNFAVHKIPDTDAITTNSVMCVMLRGALLPSMIISKEIQDYSSNSYITPFALFKIKRNENNDENNMEYVLDLDKSFFHAEELDGKDWIFADPMNATGGSFVTIVKYLKSIGIKPNKIIFINVMSTLKGALRVVRAIDNCSVHTLWMDPVLNEKAYIVPGLGDAGDRLNGKDLPGKPRNIIQLIADYGLAITNLYRAQVEKIENTVL